MPEGITGISACIKKNLAGRAIPEMGYSAFLAATHWRNNCNFIAFMQDLRRLRIVFVDSDL
jgi:hypothetical protein